MQLQRSSCWGPSCRGLRRRLGVCEAARQSEPRQGWRRSSTKQGGRGGASQPRDRSGLPYNVDSPGAPPKRWDGVASEYGRGPRPARPAPRQPSRGRRPPAADAPPHHDTDAEGAPGAPAPSRDPQDAFDAMHTRLRAQLQTGVVARRETWEKLLGHVRFPEQARAALELMAADAEVRQAAGWDWSTHGYGQTAFQLVQAAAAVGAPEVAEELLARREELHLTLNKDLVPTLMRKVAAATGGGSAAAADPAEMGAHVDVVQRLYDQEVLLRGANTPDAAYELSRVLRRAEDVSGVRSLRSQMLQEGLAVRDRLLEDLERWLAKRGVRVGG